jgi:hypothetical protein
LLLDADTRRCRGHGRMAGPGVLTDGELRGRTWWWQRPRPRRPLPSPSSSQRPTLRTVTRPVVAASSPCFPARGNVEAHRWARWRRNVEERVTGIEPGAQLGTQQWPVPPIRWVSNALTTASADDAILSTGMTRRRRRGSVRDLTQRSGGSHVHREALDPAGPVDAFVRYRPVRRACVGESTGCRHPNG